MKLLVVGVGLIGGSCALALKRAGRVREVVGVGRTRTNLDTALERGVIDRAHTLDGRWGREAEDADVVLVSAPVAQFPALLHTNGVVVELHWLPPQHGVPSSPQRLHIPGLPAPPAPPAPAGIRPTQTFPTA